MNGTRSSFAINFRPREIALTSWLRFSEPAAMLINCR